MDRKLYLWDLALILIVVLIATAGAPRLSFGGSAQGPAADRATPPDVVAVRDAALAYIRAHYPDEAPAAGMTWGRTNNTPPGALAQSDYRFTAGSWSVEVTRSTRAPDTTYYVVASERTGGFRWTGDVDASGTVRPARPDATAPNSWYNAALGQACCPERG